MNRAQKWADLTDDLLSAPIEFEEALRLLDEKRLENVLTLIEEIKAFEGSRT